MTNSVSIRVGLCSISFRELSSGEVVDLAAAAGIDGIEWGADGHVPVGDLSAAASVGERTTAAGMVCASYGTYLGVDATRGGPADACETAAALGASNIRVWAPFGPDHTADAHARRDITSQISEFAEHADQHDLTVGIEFHGWTLTDTAHSAKQLIADVGADHVFSYWQPNYWDPDVNLDHNRQVAEFDTLHHDVSHLHVYWWHGREDRQPLEAGAATWQPVLERSSAGGRWTKDRFAFLEYVPGDRPDLLDREAATLHSWL